MSLRGLRGTEAKLRSLYKQSLLVENREVGIVIPISMWDDMFKIWHSGLARSSGLDPKQSALLEGFLSEDTYLLDLEALRKGLNQREQ